MTGVASSLSFQPSRRRFPFARVCTGFLLVGTAAVSAFAPNTIWTTVLARTRHDSVADFALWMVPKNNPEEFPLASASTTQNKTKTTTGTTTKADRQNEQQFLDQFREGLDLFEEEYVSALGPHHETEIEGKKPGVAADEDKDKDALVAQQPRKDKDKDKDAVHVDYNAVARDIVHLIHRSKDHAHDWGPKGKSVGPTLIRLAWHSAGTYAPGSTPHGGSATGTIRLTEELSDPANAGLGSTAVRWLEDIHEKHPGLSYGDLYTLAGVVAVRTLGGPTVPWSYGRVDAGRSEVPPAGRLPVPATPPKSHVSEEDAAHLREVFGRMGFNDREIVALSGAHGVGRSRPETSGGYEGPRTSAEDVFDNEYFRLLCLPDFMWYVHRDPDDDGVPPQYRLRFSFVYGDQRKNTPTMVPTDMVLAGDPGFREHVNRYANDNELFFKDFAAAFSKLLELGTSNLTPVELDYDTEDHPLKVITVHFGRDEDDEDDAVEPSWKRKEL